MVSTRKLVASLALAFVPAIATAAGLHPPAMLNRFVRMSHGKIEHQFKTPVPGMTGWYITSPQVGPKGAVVYTDGGYVFMGALVTPEGANLSALYTRKFAPKPRVNKVVDELAHSKYLIDWGNPKAPVHIYAFEDMNCIFCHLFEVSAKPYVQSGDAYVQVVPVAFLKPSSPGKAAAVLTAKNRETAYEYDENHFNERAEEGGIKPVAVSPAIRKVLAHHWKMLTSDLGLSGTPGILYRSHGHWKVMDGYSATLVGHLVAEAKGH
ncbi:thiol:disulfide interchange protein DsbG [Acidithiobacillus sp. M4-SHS-6]|uniref:thiol:disulfide interchange protein DsbG n=1 Tax=Acidithiobacillus sp. M4-SHS-6 TaxID=3383024 RepID=UPI0039BDEAF5